MNFKGLLPLWTCAAIVGMPTLCQAHFLWASIDARTNTLAVGLQEVPEQQPLPLGERAPRVKAWCAAGRSVRLKPDGTWLKGSTSDNCVGASLDYGVIDRRDQQRGVFWLKYYAKTAATLGASQAILHLPVELSAMRMRDGQTTITVLKDGKPAPDADVVVEDASGKSVFEGKSGSDGTAVLPASTGPLEVRALVTDPTPGAHDGKPYELIRTYSTLTVEDPAAAPMTRQLRTAFGDMHDVVSNTAFINTVMANSLSKAQLEAHLQQRALIHEAVDRVFLRYRGMRLPYAKPQREVISLLREDLRAMGSSWPKPNAAWPLTQTLLDDIRASADKGPYFALGVFHVYYGGITHGGRDIGDMIAKQLKVAMNYYEKSDGYDDYVRGVDEITDPADQQEMVRGGVAAYRYIIAVNNLDIFRSSHLLTPSP